MGLEDKDFVDKITEAYELLEQIGRDKMYFEGDLEEILDRAKEDVATAEEELDTFIEDMESCLAEKSMTCNA